MEQRYTKDWKKQKRERTVDVNIIRPFKKEIFKFSKLSAHQKLIVREKTKLFNVWVKEKANGERDKAPEENIQTGKKMEKLLKKYEDIKKSLKNCNPKGIKMEDLPPMFVLVTVDYEWQKSQLFEDYKKEYGSLCECDKCCCHKIDEK